MNLKMAKHSPVWKGSRDTEAEVLTCLDSWKCISSISLIFPSKNKNKFSKTTRKVFFIVVTSR